MFRFVELMLTSVILLTCEASNHHHKINETFFISYCSSLRLQGLSIVESVSSSFLETARTVSRDARVRVSVSPEPLLELGAFLSVIQFEGTPALTTLVQADRSGGFRSGHHWLILVEPELVKTLLTALDTLAILLDSDVNIGIVHQNGDINLQEVYKTGIRGHQQISDVGDWIGNHLNLSVLVDTYKFTRRRDLQGLKLRAAAVGVNKMYASFSKDAEGRVSITGGYAATLFLDLQHALNFTYEVNLLEGYSYGLYSSANDSWSGLVGELQYGHADITACELSLTAERYRHLAFSHPFQIIGRRLYYRRPDKDFHADAFLRPFAVNTWLALSLSLPLLAVAACLIGRVTPGQRRQDATFGQHLFGLVTAALVQGWPGIPQDSPRRALIGTAYACYLIISVSYSAKMVAMRTAERPNLPISTLEDVLEHREWAFGFIGAALERNYLEAAEKNTLWGKLWNTRVIKDPRNLVFDVHAGLKKALDSRFVFLGFYWSCQEALRSNFSLDQACSMHVTGGEYYFKGGVAIGLTKDSPLREPIDYRLMQLRETGLLNHMEVQSMPRSFTCPEPPFSPINLKDVAPAFILLAIGVVVSLILLIVEIVWGKFKRYQVVNKIK